jgi:hypothetical protein
MFYKCRLNFRQTGMIFWGKRNEGYQFRGSTRWPQPAAAIRFDPHELANWLRKAQPVTIRPEEGNQWRRSA